MTVYPASDSFFPCSTLSSIPAAQRFPHHSMIGIHSQSTLTTFDRLAAPRVPCPLICFCALVPLRLPAIVCVHEDDCMGLRSAPSPKVHDSAITTHKKRPPFAVMICCNCRFDTLGPVEPLM